MKENKVNNHEGHRERMREEFRAGGFKTWPEHKVLEYLLYYARPLIDTNDMAHDLIKKCGGFAGVMRADRQMLKNVDGVADKTADYLLMLGELVRYYNKVRYDVSTFVLNDENCEQYLLDLFDGKRRECFYMICLDKQNRILCEEKVMEGGFDSMDMDVPKIMRTAIKSEASQVVFAHNHPSGVAKPSNADIVSTEALERMLNTSGVTLLDHIIVADGKCASMRDGGYLAISHKKSSKYI